jgi:hypothetical protein
MTRSEMNDIIQKSMSADQLSNLQYRIDAVAESASYEIEEYGDTDIGEMDFVDALFDTMNFFEGVVYSRFHDDKDKRDARKELKAVHRLLVRIGYYRPATQHEIENTHTFSNGRLRRNPFLVVDKVKVTADRAIYQFLQDTK